MAVNPLAPDLDLVLDQCREVWPELVGKRVFVTGGTGFFGCWLLESFAWANDHMKLGAEAVVLTRNVDSFRAKAPHLSNRTDIHFHVGDVRNFEFPEGGFSHVIHAATEASVRLVEESPLLMFDTTVTGTRRVLDFAVRSGASKFLLTSSGAVYGTQPSDVTHIAETYMGGPDCALWRSAYSEGKRASELLAAIYAKQFGIQSKIARCFSFVGPYLPLDTHFAVGNFIRDGLRGGPIRVGGDGTPYRSYLYAADLVIWLWHILSRGAVARAYNVGSEESVSISELAQTVKKCFDPEPEILIAKQPIPGVPPARYVPSTQRARSELGLSQRIDTCSAIKKTIFWHRTNDRL